MKLSVKQIETIAEGRGLAANHTTEALLVATANAVQNDDRIKDEHAGPLVIYLTGLYNLLTEGTPMPPAGKAD